MADRVEVVEVGPRDGLQNDAVVLPPEVRGELARRLLAAGLCTVEAAAFVRADRVPQMAGAEAVLAGAGPDSLPLLTVLVPNRRGFGRATEAGAMHVRCVLAASDAMNRANFGTGTETSASALLEVATEAAQGGIGFGIVIGTAFGCPYEGPIPAHRVLALAARFAEAGSDEVVLADTTGMANPEQVRRLCQAAVAAGFPRVGGHFHNTRNTGYANVVRALDAGVRRFDAAVGGTGGCPFAPGASGNVATEDLVHMLEAMGLRTGVDLDAVLSASRWLQQLLGHQLPAQLLLANPVGIKEVARA